MESIFDGMQPKIGDRDALQQWLDELPDERRRQAAAVIAARAVLRALPAYNGSLSYFRAAALAWVAARYPARARELPAYTGAFPALSAAASVAAGDASAADVAVTASVASRNDKDFWHLVSADVNALEEGRSPSSLASERLLPKGAPSLTQVLWGVAQENIMAEHWRPWKDWYQRRLDGKELSEEIELLFAMFPLGPDIEDIAEQNARLAQEIARLATGMTWDELPGLLIGDRVDAATASAPDVLRKPDVPQPKAAAIEPIAADVLLTETTQFDFFLSYSNENDVFAHFIDDVLRKAGYRVFAQWRDIPVGSNFVHEMNKGLARSDRLIALLSPDYVASEHAMSELASAYNDDAAGAKRKIILFIIVPVEPPPLYQQIVWRQIFSLSRDDAVQAILAAVGFDGVVTPDEPWPGAQTLDVMTRDSDEWYHVAPDTTGVMRRKPAVSARDLRKTEGFDANELYAQMRREIEKIREHVCESRDGGNFSFSERLKKRMQVLASATPEDFRSCEPLALDDALKGLLRVLELDKKEDALPPDDEIGHFAGDLNGHYQLLAVLFEALRPYRRQSARRRYKRPPPEVLAAFSVIPSVAKQTDIIDNDLANDLAATGEAIEAASEKTLGSPEDVRDAEADAHLRAAAQVTPIWNWLSNPREKFAKLGGAVKDLPEVIEKYDKAYERLSKAKPYVQWLLSWWF